MTWNGPWKLGQKDRRYAGFVAHIFDVLAHHDWAIGMSANALGISTGKLIASSLVTLMLGALLITRGPSLNW